MGRLSNFVRKFVGSDSVGIKDLKDALPEKRLKVIRELLSKDLIKIENVEIDSQFVEDMTYPQIISLSTKVDASEVNSDIQQHFMKEIYESFSSKAFDVIPSVIASNIQGMEEIKKAAALQLFSKQPVHILILGDPGTGKTDILRASFKLAPISSFGLGSGTSGAGLVATVKGSKIMKGLLPLADGGVCCIDELNLMKEESRAGLYNAMEKGFVTYDKGGHHYKFDAHIKVLATANPKGDKFTGDTIEKLKEELPFDSALLTRFHLSFFVRKPDLEKFKEIASSIASGKKYELSKGDIDFIKGYIEFVNKKEVHDIRKTLQKKVVDFISDIKKDEKNYLIEVSPRLVLGFMRMCKALALIEGREDVEEKDIDRIKEIVMASLKIE